MTRVPPSRDARLLYLAGFVRSATVSLIGVTVAIHLAQVGFSATQIGLLIGVGLAGSSLATITVSLRGDAWGRKRSLVSLAILSATGYLALAAFTDALALVPLAFVGMLNGMGRDRGAASALDQAILPGTVPDDRRSLFSG
jgi:MFS family permease